MPRCERYVYEDGKPLRRKLRFVTRRARQASCHGLSFRLVSQSNCTSLSAAEGSFVPRGRSSLLRLDLAAEDPESATPRLDLGALSDVRAVPHCRARRSGSRQVSPVRRRAAGAARGSRALSLSLRCALSWVGKSHCAVLVRLWFISSRAPANVLVTRHVRTVAFRSTARCAHLSARLPSASIALRRLGADSRQPRQNVSAPLAQGGAAA